MQRTELLEALHTAGVHVAETDRPTEPQTDVFEHALAAAPLVTLEPPETDQKKDPAPLGTGSLRVRWF